MLKESSFTDPTNKTLATKFRWQLLGRPVMITITHDRTARQYLHRPKLTVIKEKYKRIVSKAVEYARNKMTYFAPNDPVLCSTEKANLKYLYSNIIEFEWH